MNKIIFFKSLDKVLGKPLICLLSKIRAPRTSNISVPRSVLFIRPGGIGDAVLLLPVINSLKSKFPGSDIDVLCEKRNADVFGLSHEIHKVYLYDKDLDLLKCLTTKYDIVIDTEQWHRLSAVVAYLAAPIRIGFATNEREKLFTHKILYSHDEYEVYSFFRLVAPLTDKKAEFDPDEPFLFPPDTLPSHLLPEFHGHNKNLIAIFPGASVPERRWGGERFGAIAEELSRQGFRIIIFGSKADRQDAEQIRKISWDSIDLTGKTSLGEVASALKRCRLLITADSGLMHIAYAVGTPTVSLFGSGIEKKWAPPGRSHKILRKHLPCSPCTRFGYTPHCRRNVSCLSTIGVREVIEAAEGLLRQNT